MSANDVMSVFDVDILEPCDTLCFSTSMQACLKEFHKSANFLTNALLIAYAWF